jgi:RNA polymerase sigma factor (sigma-70 family)
LEGSYNNEQHLLRALANGERKVTELIYKQQFPVINKWLQKNGCAADDAPDLFQEAMLVLFGKVQDPEFRLSCSVGTYLFSITKHLWYKKFKKSQSEPVRFFEDGDSEEGNNDLAYHEDVNVHREREAHFDQLGEAMEQIGEPCRSLLQAYYHKDKSMQEIAADFGYTNPDNAKTQKYKCLTRLRKIFYSLQG